MYRSIAAVFFVALALLQVASAVDVSKYKNVRLDLNDNDTVPKTRLGGVLPGDSRGTSFIGDLTVGQRYPDETIFRRVLDFDNPSNVVQSTSLNLSISNGVIHYISVENIGGSRAVVCDHPNNIGSSRANVNIRVPPNSRSSLTLTIAAH